MFPASRTSEESERPLFYAPDSLPSLGRISLDQILDEQRDVVGAFAERRDVDGEDVQSIVEVTPKLSGEERSLELAVRRGEHAHVDRNRLGAPDALELSFLQDPEESDLGLCRQLAHLVEEERSTIGQLETAKPSLDRAGERPFSCPNSSDAIREGGMAAQFTRTKARPERFEVL